MRKEELGIGAALPYLAVQVLIDGDVQTLAAVCACGPDLYQQLRFSEASLNQGRDKSVLRSSAEDTFSSAEMKFVGRMIHRDWKRPGDVAFPIPDQEKQVALQVGQQVLDSWQIQPQGLRDLLRF